MWEMLIDPVKLEIAGRVQSRSFGPGARAARAPGPEERL
jgi:hypothetical protein